MIYGLNEKIKMLRQQASISQVELAERLRISKSAVNAWETGTNSPSLVYVIKLAQIFKVSTDYLLGVNDKLIVDISKLDELQQQAVMLMIKLFERSNSEKTQNK